MPFKPLHNLNPQPNREKHTRHLHLEITRIDTNPFVTSANSTPIKKKNTHSTSPSLSPMGY
ncbi:hypothetical protein HanIR_Chr17g0851421 [Helianthus annuus]|nr:hypothetical protein HanIR_Chr17g0851421 [Helianthus annuus]